MTTHDWTADSPEPRLPETDAEKAEALERWRRLYAPHAAKKHDEGSVEEMLVADMTWSLDHWPVWCPVCGETHAPVDPCAPIAESRLTGILGQPGIRPLAEERIAAAVPRGDTLIGGPRQAAAGERPCSLVRVHIPRVVITENHHSKPVFLQRRLWGEERFDADTWLCSNCHEAVHAWLWWLLGERKQPKGVGRAAKAHAQATYDWYRAALDRAPRSLTGGPADDPGAPA